MSERDEMAEAFEQSRHYFCGESPGDRAVNWLIWKDAWQAARAAQAVQTLTDERILAVVDACFDQGYYEVSNRDWITFARAILAAAPQPSPRPAVPALTDEQIAAQHARYAIDGAIAYGRMGTNQPPAGHWLTEYWAIGQQLAKLGETSIWDNQTPVDKTVKFARYDAMEEAGRQASEEMRRLERYLEETSAQQPSPEPKKPEHAHDWRFSLQDHLYKCDCGETRGDYPFGAASFKD